MTNPRGRPVDGRVQIDSARLEALPEHGSSFAFAKILGVTAPTVRNWILLEGAPATRGEKATWTLYRDQFSQWLKEKGKVCETISPSSEIT